MEANLKSAFSRVYVHVIVLSSAFFLLTCGQGYRDISTENGRQAVIDDAQNYLTAGLCEEAISVLQPLYSSQYANEEVKLLYASAYGCKGGMNMAAQIGELTNVSGADIWSPLVKTNYSASNADLHIVNLDLAADIIRQTNFVPGAYEASSRSKDANTFMTFVQLNNITSVISPLGAANKATGKRTQAVCAACSVADVCHVQVAVAFMDDALDFMGNGPVVTTLNSALNTACAGACPTNKVLAVCMGDAVLQATGQAMITAIGAQ